MNVKDIFMTALDKVKGWYEIARDWVLNYYAQIKPLWPYEDFLQFKYVVLIALALILILLIVIIASINRAKKRKVKYYVDGKVYAKQKVKFRKPLNFPAVEKEGMVLVGWFKNKKLTKEYTSDRLEKRKNLKLYAKFEEAKEVIASTEENVEAIENVDVISTVDSVETTRVIESVENVGSVEAKASVEEAVIAKETKEESVEETASVEEIEIDALLEDNELEVVAINEDISKLYDDIRYEMLGYERAKPFKGVGVTRKQIVAEMFERDGVINLYLAVDPEFMKEKGYNVSSYDSPEFAVVPCRKVVKTYTDYLEAVDLIEEAMLLNNFVKSDFRRLSRTVSDETTRKNGFAFFVKNDTIATSAADYYKFLRGMVLCYSLAPGNQFSKDLDNKMILKIFKKGEQIFLYLALDAEKEGLEFVGYDKNFIDTPCKFEIKVADDLIRANQLIDKLMAKHGMEKHPEEAELTFEEEIKTNCGFGYRIRY